MKIDRLLLATSNSGKLREYRRLAPSSAVTLDLIPGFVDLQIFDEGAPTFAENAAGKALYYSRFADGVVLAEDSGLVVPALNGAPGVKSARYAGENATDAGRVRKLLGEMVGMRDDERAAKFVCVTALACQGRAIAIISDDVRGSITPEPRGVNGFGYDPVLFVPEIGKTFAETTAEEKDRLSHRGKAFRKLLAFVMNDDIDIAAPQRR
ncbi:MAG: RdgB/HAM1 family non-canonical purine NTP pyrophosphatase [Candidatus Acidiferrales bacterium]